MISEKKDIVYNSLIWNETNNFIKVFVYFFLDEKSKFDKDLASNFFPMVIADIACSVSNPLFCIYNHPVYFGEVKNCGWDKERLNAL